MFKALVDNKIVEATPKVKGKCPHCGADVIAKCGKIKVDHWAHKSKEECDSWYEPETIWHYNWKKTFGLEYAEKRITRKGVWHIADILTKDKIVIEFQNSPISNIEIKKREDFYGEKMIWVINGEKFIDNIEVKEEVEYKNEWTMIPLTIKGRDLLYFSAFYTYNAIVIRYLEENGFKYWEEGNRYCKIIDSDKLEVEISKIQKDIDKLYLKHKKKTSKYYYNWKRVKRNWQSSKRNIYIDVGNGKLYMIEPNNVDSEGKLTIVDKGDFIKEYK